MPVHVLNDFWFLLQSKRFKETFLEQQLQSVGFETFYPSYPVKPVNPRARQRKPFYPGYMFVRATRDADRISQVRYLPGSLGWVTFGGELALVPEIVVDGIRRRLQEFIAAQSAPGSAFAPGDAVQITEGPFAGYEGIFDTHLSGASRARVLLSFVQAQQKTLVLPVGYIKKKDQR